MDKSETVKDDAKCTATAQKCPASESKYNPVIKRQSGIQFSTPTPAKMIKILSLILNIFSFSI